MAESHKRTRIISVTGGKGGVGKSSVSASLAIHYAQQGARVLIMDADLGMADLNQILGVAPERTLLDVLNGQKAQAVLADAHGVKLLPACNASTRLANITAQERDEILASLRELENDFDTLIVDCPAGIGTNTVAFAAAALDVLVVVNPDPTALTNAYASMKVLYKEHKFRRLFLVPNSIRTESQAQGVHQRLSMLAGRFLPGLELKLIGALPFDPNVRTAGSSGVPFIVYNRDSPASRALIQLARNLDLATARESRPQSIGVFWERALAGDTEAAAQEPPA
jgi:flagellar biosynthesis protein FlhG